MKPLYLTIFIFCPVLFIFQSCVVSVPCDDAKLNLCFIAFPETETKSFIVKWYRKDTNFTVLVDSLLLDKSNCLYSNASDSLTIDYAKGTNQCIKSGYDYKIYLPLSKKTYAVSNIIEFYETRKVGFRSNPPTCSNPIKSYNINGQKIEGSDRYGAICINK